VGADRAARQSALDRAAANAPFLAGLITRRSLLAEAFVEQGYAAAIPLAAPYPHDPGDVADQLRRYRADVALLTALADLAGEHDLWRTVAILSDFADAACDTALTAAFADRAPGEEPRGFAVIALGKQGSRELNYSSDIDPILIFDPATVPHRERDDPAEAATRLARRWVELLSARTPAGYVLRVDLRLRPSPEVTPIALPVDAAIAYYESQALAWEQAAFIRARCVAGDRALGEHFLSAISPFIWRSVRDYGQLGRIADMSARIRDHYDRGQLLGPGFDVKRGRGGIREVEFFAQSQQLIHGGRNPALRAPMLCDALPALAAAGHIEPDSAAAMLSHYATLRTIEHRLQMVGDQQTHSLPAQAAALDAVARLHGLADGAGLIDLLQPVTADVASRFDRLLSGMGAASGWPMDAEPLAAAVAATGFPDTDAAIRRITEWRGGHSRVLRSPAAREALEQVLPDLLAALARAPDPVQALNRFDAMVGGLPSAVNLFHLLHAQPQLLATLTAILSFAPTLAAALGRRAELLEGLIDASALVGIPDRQAAEARLRRAPPGEGYEQLLDRVRRDVGELRFALGAQVVEGVSDPLHIAAGYADIAEAAIAVLADATIGEFERAHGRVPGGELLILALGRLGGAALTHASDLDLILLFTGDHLAESDGERPLGATIYFNRLAQRVIAALSVPTAAGPLYDVDTRLRPQGNKGPLVAMLDAFARYQHEEAWTWEHMALTRARPIYGSAHGRAALQAIIDAVLRQPRDATTTLADIVAMRRDMRAHKGAKGALDVKMVAGGLVDLEFAIHTQQLLHSTAFTPRLDTALDALVAAGLSPADLMAAYALLGRLLVALRLMSADMVVDDAATRDRIARAVNYADWAAVETGYAAARATVSNWAASLGLMDEGANDGDRFTRP
jgi:[glutamine synthetase] adenylyltransferase / [glutamine synthetase]-adenylyl-L-tyrosine phosphorylase